jgi:hypothetical protein
MATAEKMQALINAFPCLKQKALCWDRVASGSAHFVAQCRGLSSGERQAAAFVLHVWNWAESPPGLKFNFAAAINSWDQRHIEVVREWMRNPWYA